MVEQKYIELMQKEIDGSISYLEKSRLASFLKGSEEARELHQQLRRVHDCLVDTPLVDPPESLRPNIMSKIVPRPRPTVARAIHGPSLWESLVARFRLQPAIPFAVGVVLGVLALVPVISTRQGGNDIDSSRLIGTLLNAGADAQVIDSKIVSFGLVRGSLEVRALDGWVLVDVALKSPDQISLVMDFDSDDISFYGLTNLDQGTTFLESSPTELKLTHTGVQHYYLAFADNPKRAAEIAFRLESGGEIYQEAIRTGDAER
jgi:hypothetical protein